MNHDFDAAIDFTNQYDFDLRQMEQFEDLEGVTETIKFALRLAKAVCGEPSVKVLKAGSEAINDVFDTSKEMAAAGFKAMTQQLIKEISGE